VRCFVAFCVDLFLILFRSGNFVTSDSCYTAEKALSLLIDAGPRDVTSGTCLRLSLCLLFKKVLAKFVYSSLQPRKTHSKVVTTFANQSMIRLAPSLSIEMCPFFTDAKKIIQSLFLSSLFPPIL